MSTPNRSRWCASRSSPSYVPAICEPPGSGSSRQVATRGTSPSPSMISTGAWRPSKPVSIAVGSTRTMRTDRSEVTPMDDLDLIADLNDQDDDGLGWSTLADAAAPERVRPGAMLLAGNSQAHAVVRVVAVDDDGQVHFAILPGSVAKNRHLLDRTVA